MPAQVIAELATSHGGDLDLAARMITHAKDLGCDYAKIQAYDCRFLRPGDPQDAWLRQSELSEEGIRFLRRVCGDVGIKFLATVFGPERVPLIRELSDEVKIGSGEQYDDVVLDAVSLAHFDRILIGCGMMQVAFGVELWGQEIPLFGVSAYPACAADAEFAIADAIRARGDDWGYSDHTPNLLACDFAIGLGASFLEIHVALAGTDKRLGCDKLPPEVETICRYAHEGRSDARANVERARQAAIARFVGRWSHGR